MKFIKTNLAIHLITKRNLQKEKFGLLQLLHNTYSMNRRCTARLKFDARQVAKNAIYTAFICDFRFQFTHTFLSQKLYMHFFVTKRICSHFFLSRTQFTRFFRENDLGTLSGKFFRVESCHPESSDFLGLCCYISMMFSSVMLQC